MGSPVGHPEDNVVTWLDPERDQPQGEGVGARPELPLRDALVAEDDRFVRGIAGRRLVEHLPTRQRGSKPLRHRLTASICSSICRARPNAWASSS